MKAESRQIPQNLLFISQFYKFVCWDLFVCKLNLELSWYANKYSRVQESFQVNLNITVLKPGMSPEVVFVTWKRNVSIDISLCLLGWNQRWA